MTVDTDRPELNGHTTAGIKQLRDAADRGAAGLLGADLGTDAKRLKCAQASPASSQMVMADAASLDTSSPSGLGGVVLSTVDAYLQLLEIPEGEARRRA